MKHFFVIVVQLLNHVWLFATPWTVARQSLLSFTNSRSLLISCPLSQWCHPTISSSVSPLSPCRQSFLATGSFPTSHRFASGGWSTKSSASASVLPTNIQGWFPLGLTGLISLQSKGLSRVFSNTKILSVIGKWIYDRFDFNFPGQYYNSESYSLFYHLIPNVDHVCGIHFRILGLNTMWHIYVCSTFGS